MLAKKFRINTGLISEKDLLFLRKKQQMYSYAYRKLYKNFELIEHVWFKEYICREFNLNTIELRSVISEVKVRKAQFKSSISKKNKRIDELKSEIENLYKEKKVFDKKGSSQKSKEKITRSIFKVNKKKGILEHSLSNDIVFGTRELLQSISHLHNEKHQLEKDGNKAKELAEINIQIEEKTLEFKERRITSFYLLGEANQKGNRFFDFDFKNNCIIYKPYGGRKIKLNFGKYKSYSKTLSRLQELIDNKGVSITMHVSDSDFSLIYDDKKLSPYNLTDTSERDAGVKEIKLLELGKDDEKEAINAVYKRQHDLQRQMFLLDKRQNRTLSIDLNPDYIGCSVVEKLPNDQIKIIKAFYYDLSEANKRLEKSVTQEFRTHMNEKRKFSIHNLWKDLFNTLTYYKCESIAFENLDLDGKTLDNKEANRKTKNLWYREIAVNAINKYTTQLGITQIPVNPCYTSYIGNIMYDYIDPVNASIEIGRRALSQFEKGKFYPKFSIDTIADTMSKRNDINDNSLRDVLTLKGCTDWVKAYKFSTFAGLRYRSVINDVSYKYHTVKPIFHESLTKICFLQKNCLSLPKNS